MRAYFGNRADSGMRLSGTAALPKFIEESIKCGMPSEFYAKAKFTGPLATFNGACDWVQHPYRNGIVLIGDAAATTDPAWGQGLSMGLRDVRVLRDQLLRLEDWDEAANAYAREHDRNFDVVHTWEDWFTTFFYDRGAEADARRTTATALIERDPTRVPDHMMSGPEVPIDDSVRARFFGEQ